MRRKILLICLIVIGILGYFVGQGYFQKDEKTALAYEPDNLIRFHVLANSDTDADQELKRKVRDKIVEAMSPEFSKAKNIEEAKRIVANNLDIMKSIAEKTIESEGYSYPVQVVTGTFQFPAKTYGKLTLPPGKYQAVRILIGKAQGANWWCVLFPPLCFVDVSKGLNIPEPSSQAVTTNSGDIQENKEEKVEVKFKILEIMQENNINIDEVKASFARTFE